MVLRHKIHTRFVCYAREYPNLMRTSPRVAGILANTALKQSASSAKLTTEGVLMAELSPTRIVITVLGKNRPGIVAGVTRVLGEANVDIRDITQSILEGIFTMTMLADITESKLSFAELQKALSEAGELSGVTVTIQREDVFNFMYRL